MLAGICVCLLLLFGIAHASGFEPIPITYSGTMNKIDFDGKWSSQTEWKASSLNTYTYSDENQIIIRSAHQDNFVYIFLDAINDYTHNVGEDYAMICFDTKNTKSSNADTDDYCFTTVLGSKTGVVYGGGYDTTDHFEKIQNPEGFIAISTISDDNDRYTTVPHSSYEFKIPTSFVGRESVYGFYFTVYDGQEKKFYTYPQEINQDSDNIPSPSMWGEIYSPDKSLPEFDFPIISLLLGIMLPVFIKKIKNVKAIIK